MLIGKLRWLPLAFCLLSAIAHAQEKKLEPGKAVEREIACDESHAYQIRLEAGQFVRFRLEQRTIDLGLILTAPDGKQLVEMDLTGVGEQESLSLEAETADAYRVTVRGSRASSLRGSYRLEITIQAAATAHDRKRLAAEALLVEANELRKQAGKTAQQVIEELEEEALPRRREMSEPQWTAYTLLLIGSASDGHSQFVEASNFNQTIGQCSKHAPVQLLHPVAPVAGCVHCMYFWSSQINRSLIT